jgi:hypothetical protein
MFPVDPPIYDESEGDHKHEGGDNDPKSPFGWIAHQQIARPQATAAYARDVSETKLLPSWGRSNRAQTRKNIRTRTGVALMTACKPEAAGGPTNLILSTPLARHRHPLDMYHLAHTTSIVACRADGMRKGPGTFRHRA